MNPNQNGQALSDALGWRPHVQVQTIFAGGGQICDCRICLYTRPTELVCDANSIPLRRRVRWAPTEIAYGRSSVRNTVIRAETVLNSPLEQAAFHLDGFRKAALPNKPNKVRPNSPTATLHCEEIILSLSFVATRSQIRLHSGICVHLGLGQQVVELRDQVVGGWNAPRPGTSIKRNLGKNLLQLIWSDRRSGAPLGCNP
jgi:hypothetical protein